MRIIDADKLKDELVNNSECIDSISDVFDILDNAPTIESKAKWIPINEETIETLQDHYYYLVAHKYFTTPMKAKYHNDSFKHFEVFSFKSSQISYIFLNSTDDITHFMELPELPKEEEGEE